MNKYYLRLNQKSTDTTKMRPQLAAFLDKKGDAKHVGIKKSSMSFSTEAGARDWIKREAKDFKKVGGEWQWVDEANQLEFSLEIMKV